MTYKELYPLIKGLRKRLDSFVLCNDQINGIYHLAKNWIEKLSELSYYKKDLRALFGKWLKSGGTLLLRDKILPFVNYNYNKLIDFNAFSFLDTLSANK